MKLKFWGDEAPQGKQDPNEADALRGKYAYEDLVDRKRQLIATPLTGPSIKGKNGNPDSELPEEDIDTRRRLRSVVTNGQGSLGADFPHGKESSVADYQLGKITRWTTNNLKATNHLRRFMEADDKDHFHLAVDRSIERDQPQVVLGYKPMFYPGTALPVTGESAEDQRIAERKKP